MTMRISTCQQRLTSLARGAYDIRLTQLQTQIEALLGPNMCHILAIRPVGGCGLDDGLED